MRFLLPGSVPRAALAKALINKPQLLLLDEPTASLDPSAAQIIRERIRNLASRDRCGILWTSHNMYEVEAVCDRVMFLSRGKVLLQGDPKQLPREHHLPRPRLRHGGPGVRPVGHPRQDQPERRQG